MTILKEFRNMVEELTVVRVLPDHMVKVAAADDSVLDCQGNYNNKQYLSKQPEVG